QVSRRMQAESTSVMPANEKNALTVAAILMGMTVIASLVSLNSGGREPAARTGMVDRNTLEPSTPTFLDRPARTQSAHADTTREPAAAAVSAARQVSSRPDQAHAPNDSPATTTMRPSSYASLGASIPTSKPSGDVDERTRAFNAALRRSALATSNTETGSSVAMDAKADGRGSSSLAADEAHLISFGDSIMRGAVQGSPISTVAPASSPESTNPRHAFLALAGDLGGRPFIARLEPASSPYVLQAGTVIPAILLTSITSDLPGDCMGQVARDVYDSRTQRVLLLPKGSKLMCRYDDQVAAGQDRLLVAWTRLLLPDGRSMTLPGLALKDPQGQTGAKGDVDNHTRRVFGKALLLSAIGAATQLSQPRQASVLAAPTTGQVVAGAAGQEMSSVALEILRRGMDQGPTITVLQGQTFNVFLNGDLVFDAPYTTSP
ncbi:MAG: TrbI/VirB10 family protein, partial [Betaproteobacteria bacterium]